MIKSLVLKFFESFTCWVLFRFFLKTMGSELFILLDTFLSFPVGMCFNGLLIAKYQSLCICITQHDAIIYIVP